MSKIMDAVDELVKIYFDRKLEDEYELAITFLNIIKPLMKDRSGGSIEMDDIFLLPDGCDGHLYNRVNKYEVGIRAGHATKIDCVTGEERQPNQNDILIKSLQSNKYYLMDCNEDVIRSLRFQDLKGD